MKNVCLVVGLSLLGAFSNLTRVFSFVVPAKSADQSSAKSSIFNQLLNSDFREIDRDISSMIL